MTCVQMLMGWHQVYITVHYGVFFLHSAGNFLCKGGIEFYCRNTIHQNELLPATGCSLINEIFGPSGEMALHDTNQKAIKERGVHIYTISRIFSHQTAFPPRFHKSKSSLGTVPNGQMHII